MSLMTMLLIAWVVFTIALVLLLIYRSTLEMHEDDQLFLSDGENHIRKEQEELQLRMNRLTPFVRGLGAASATLLVVMGGYYIWDGIQRLQ